MSKKISMRKTREILRLKWHLGRSNRETAISVNVSSSTVSDCVRRAKRAGLSWPLDGALNEAALEALLYSGPRSKVSDRVRCVDWGKVHHELKRKGVTLQLIWHEYRLRHPDGLGYSRYCELYREWKTGLSVCMRQNHKAGEKIFVDYAGMTASITNKQTGEIKSAQIFVAVLGASNYTYVEATHSQSLEDWIGSHVRAFDFFGGVSEIVVIDNLRSGVSKAHKYEPDINLSYLEMANHYGVAVIPARVRASKDKAKAEQVVLHIER